jgi:hypothetical protein
MPWRVVWQYVERANISFSRAKATEPMNSQVLRGLGRRLHALLAHHNFTFVSEMVIATENKLPRQLQSRKIMAPRLLLQRQRRDGK